MSASATVLLDATAIPENRGGVGRYVDGLVSAIGADVVIACQPRDAPVFAELNPTARVVPVRGIGSTVRRLLWEQLGLPRLARRQGADVIHSPHYTIPLLTRARRVVTFHDATFFSDPDVHTRIKRTFFRSWMRVAGRLAAAIVVPSRATASEVSRYVRIPRDRFVVAYHGVDPAAFHPPTEEELAAFRDTSGVRTGDWVAFLGTLEPRKNVLALVEAFRALGPEAQGVTLVLAGGRGWGEVAESLRPDDRVVPLGYLPAGQLRALLGGAAVVAYPSLGEGFGLPVLEAMACRAAVLTTPRLALPEVGGDAVAYTEPDPVSIREALRDLLTDRGKRDRLGSLAAERAAQFTWKRCAEAHLAAYGRPSGG